MLQRCIKIKFPPSKKGYLQNTLELYLKIIITPKEGKKKYVKIEGNHIFKRKLQNVQTKLTNEDAKRNLTMAA